jgi:hypothetical protein
MPEERDRECRVEVARSPAAVSEQAGVPVEEVAEMVRKVERMQIQRA